MDFVRARQSSIQPPRLLYRIHNGRGAHTTIEYASMHDKTAVEQHPEQTWSDGRPKASPHTQWVVRSLTVVDDFAATTSTTSQFYKNPRHGADDEGYYSFRGFEEVTTTGPSGAKTVQRYAYTPDWSGRLVTTLVQPAEAPAEVRSIDKTTWVERELFGARLFRLSPHRTRQKSPILIAGIRTARSRETLMARLGDLLSHQSSLMMITCWTIFPTGSASCHSGRRRVRTLRPNPSSASKTHVLNVNYSVDSRRRGSAASGASR